jgi:hypothetical protein
VCDGGPVVDQVRIRPATVTGWLQAGGFPERRVRSNRRRGEARLLHEVANGRASVQRSFSAGRIAALLVKAPRLLSDAQRSYLDGFRLCPGAATLRRLALQFRAVIRWHNASKLPSWIENAMLRGLALRRLIRQVAQFDCAPDRASRLTLELLLCSRGIDWAITGGHAMNEQQYGWMGPAFKKVHQESDWPTLDRPTRIRRLKDACLSLRDTEAPSAAAQLNDFSWGRALAHFEGDQR